MKKILISFAALAVSAAAIIAVNANNRMDEQFEANMEALARSEIGEACGGCSTDYAIACCIYNFNGVDFLLKRN